MSKIEVDAITEQSGSTLTTGGGAGKTVVVDATTVTLGRCGGTVALASGASQTGFGRTGTVDWQTGSIKTSTFTAANGEGYFANTSGGTFTMNLPAGSAGAIVSVVDYTNTFQTNALTISPNGSEKIGGIAAAFIAGVEGQSLTFVYVDGTEGWKNVQDSTSNAIGNQFIFATGGTITTSGSCKIHTFTSPGTFTVCQVHPCAANNLVSYLVVGGGGGGSPSQGGVGASGGGAGGYREVKSPVTPYTASPLDGYPSAPNRITVTATAFPITVGAGGGSSPVPTVPAVGLVGNNSTFATITSAGGGFGAGGYPAPANPPAGIVGGPGGSGGGGGTCTSSATNGKSGGTGNTPPVSPSQGNPGGTGTTRGGAPYGTGGGGGGATAAGSNGGPGSGNGGNGATTNITASEVAYAGGGGGGWNGSTSGGTGGGGGAPPNASSNGTANTGGGGSASSASPYTTGGTGGSGIVIIRYKFR